MRPCGFCSTPSKSSRKRNTTTCQRGLAWPFLADTHLQQLLTWVMALAPSIRILVRGVKHVSLPEVETRLSLGVPGVPAGSVLGTCSVRFCDTKGITKDKVMWYGNVYLCITDFRWFSANKGFSPASPRRFLLPVGPRIRPRCCTKKPSGRWR